MTYRERREANEQAVNEFLVAEEGAHLMILRLSPVRLTRQSALNLAAWLVALADWDHEFDELLAKVRRT